MEAPSTRKEAKSLGLKHYYTGNPCSHGHYSVRLVSDKKCLECQRIRSKDYFYRNKEKKLKKCREYYWANHEREKGRRNNWHKKYPEKHIFNAAKRKAAKLNATPSWLNEKQLQQIRDIYDSCPDGYHVDHIVPLQGVEVSGLHVPWNLQHLPASENISKYNVLLPPA